MIGASGSARIAVLRKLLTGEMLTPVDRAEPVIVPCRQITALNASPCLQLLALLRQGR